MKKTGFIGGMDVFGRIELPEEVQKELNLTPGRPLRMLLDIDTKSITLNNSSDEETPSFWAEKILGKYSDKIYQVNISGKIITIIAEYYDSLLITGQAILTDKIDFTTGVAIALADIFDEPVPSIYE